MKKELPTLTVMILSFLLFMITLINGLQKFFVLKQVSLVIIVMAAVAIVPALARPVYLWMTAENEEDASTREVLEKKRTGIMFVAAFVTALVLAALNLFVL